MKLTTLDDIRALLTDAKATEDGLTALAPTSHHCSECDALIDPLRFRLASPELTLAQLARHQEVLDLLDEARSAARGCNGIQIMQLVNQGMEALHEQPTRTARLVNGVLGRKIAPFEAPYSAEAIRTMKRHQRAPQPAQAAPKASAKPRSRPQGGNGANVMLAIAAICMVGFITNAIADNTASSTTPPAASSHKLTVARMRPGQTGTVPAYAIWVTPSHHLRVNPGATVRSARNSTQRMIVLRRTARGYEIVSPSSVESTWFHASNQPGLPVTIR